MAFKMKGSPMARNFAISPLKDPGHGETKKGHEHAWNTPGRYADTLGKVTADMTDAQLLALSKENRTSGETNRLKSGKFGASIKDLQRQRTFLTDSTEEIKPKVTETKKTIMPVTLQDNRDLTFQNVLEGSPELTDERALEIGEQARLNKTKELRKAVEKKYGKMYHEITDPTDRQMAGDAMVDEQGNILPMSSASGQYSGSSALNKKTSGFKMPGYGKRKK